MKLDQTFISIRRRNGSELFDLALTVVRGHLRPLLILLLVGALPWILIDCWLVWPLMNLEVGDPDRWGFSWLMMLLVISQAHYGASLITVYLGEAMFVGQPDWRSVAKQSLRVMPLFVWLHGFVRLAFPILLITWAIDYELTSSFGLIAGFWLPLCVTIAALVRAFRPFASEMLLLEKTPLRHKDPNAVTYRRRSRAIHSHAASELFGRFTLSCIFGIPMAISLQSLFVGVDSLLNLAAGSDWTLASYYWVASLWLTTGFVAVFRFLSYIDLRIRQEGWAIELRMRAEGRKLRSEQADGGKGVVSAVVVGLFVFLATFPAAANDVAETGQESLRQQQLPWYDAATDSVVPIELPAREPAGSLARQTVAERAPKSDSSWLDWLRDLDFSFLEGLRWLLWLIPIGLLIAILIWALRNFESRTSLVTDDRLPQRSRAQSVAQLPFSLDMDASDEDFRQLAANACAAKDYRQAIMWLFSHVLVSLDQGNLIRLKKGKTNRQYLSEVQSHRRLSSYYKDVMLPFESTFFGDHKLTGSQFDACWRGLAEFEQHLAGTLKTPRGGAA